MIQRNSRPFIIFLLMLINLIGTYQIRAQQEDTVILPGTFQPLLGCDGEWQPDCAATALTYMPERGLYVGVFELPAGSYEFKVAINGTWDVNYGLDGVPDGPNIPMTLPADAVVTFTYDPTTNIVSYEVSVEDVVPAETPVDGEGDDEAGGVLEQWANSAMATSNYAGDGPELATGPADAGSCQDSSNVWYSNASNSQETLTLTYAVPVQPTRINVYQNWQPGSITGIYVVPVGGGDPILLPNSADPSRECPSIFTLEIAPDTISVIVDTVIIELDQSIGNNWNGVDAVALFGVPGESGTIVETQAPDQDEEVVQAVPTATALEEPTPTQIVPTATATPTEEPTPVVPTATASSEPTHTPTAVPTLEPQDLPQTFMESTFYTVLLLPNDAPVILPYFRDWNVTTNPQSILIMSNFDLDETADVLGCCDPGDFLLAVFNSTLDPFAQDLGRAPSESTLADWIELTSESFEDSSYTVDENGIYFVDWGLEDQGIRTFIVFRQLGDTVLRFELALSEDADVDEVDSIIADAIRMAGGAISADDVNISADIINESLELGPSPESLPVTISNSAFTLKVPQSSNENRSNAATLGMLPILESFTDENIVFGDPDFPVLYMVIAPQSASDTDILAVSSRYLIASLLPIVPTIQTASYVTVGGRLAARIEATWTFDDASVRIYQLTVKLEDDSFAHFSAFIRPDDYDEEVIQTINSAAASIEAFGDGQAFSCLQADDQIGSESISAEFFPTRQTFTFQYPQSWAATEDIGRGMFTFFSDEAILNQSSLEPGQTQVAVVVSAIEFSQNFNSFDDVESWVRERINPPLGEATALELGDCDALYFMAEPGTDVRGLYVYLAEEVLFTAIVSSGSELDEDTTATIEAIIGSITLDD